MKYGQFDFKVSWVSLICSYLAIHRPMHPERESEILFLLWRLLLMWMTVMLNIAVCSASLDWLLCQILWLSVNMWKSEPDCQSMQLLLCNLNVCMDGRNTLKGLGMIYCKLSLLWPALSHAFLFSKVLCFRTQFWRKKMLHFKIRKLQPQMNSSTLYNHTLSLFV